MTAVLNSEWIKLRTLRSSWISLLTAFGLIVGLGLLISLITTNNWPHESAAQHADFDPEVRSTAGIYLGQLAFMVLGVLFITGEYSTGMIRSTFAAFPRRLPVLWAKLAVFLAVVWVLATVATLLAFLGGQAIFSSQHIQTSLGAPHVARQVFGAGLYLTGIGLLSVGVGFLLRNTAAAIATMSAVLFVVPPVVDFLPASWSNAIDPYLPTNAGTQLLAAHPSQLGAWPGFAVLCGYVVLVCAAAAVMLVRRDV
jgi:ABC-type transport system involved in multi-copper enzyme maturation permease subunit